MIKRHPRFSFDQLSEVDAVVMKDFAQLVQGQGLIQMILDILNDVHRFASRIRGRFCRRGQRIQYVGPRGKRKRSQQRCLHLLLHAVIGWIIIGIPLEHGLDEGIELTGCRSRGEALIELFGNISERALVCRNLGSVTRKAGIS